MMHNWQDVERPDLGEGVIDIFCTKCGKRVETALDMFEIFCLGKDARCEEIPATLPSQHYF